MYCLLPHGHVHCNEIYTMPSLLVIPAAVYSTLQDSGLGLSKLKDFNYMEKNMSASDLADIHVAQLKFPFTFSPELGIVMAQSPLDQLAIRLSEEGPDAQLHQDLYYRVNGRIQTCMLRSGGNAANTVYEYSLHAVDENLWVAVQQRLRDEPSDPGRLLLRANSSFFDELIAQALHTLPFERVCSTNLFTYYLGSL
jgi:hypothetical protein